MDLLKEIAMIREPLIPALQNKSMRELAKALHSIDVGGPEEWAGEVLQDTSGGRATKFRQLDETASTQLVGMKQP